VLPRSWALPLIMTGMNAIIAFACVAEQLQMQRSLVDRRGIVEVPLTGFAERSN
jgi:hypothetical protein